MKLISKISTAMALCVVAACGSSSSPSNATTGTGTPTNGNATSGGNVAVDGNGTQAGAMSVLTVSGTITNFAFDTNAVTDDTNTLQVGVLDANSLYPNGTLAIISATPVSAAGCTTAAGVRSCKFSIANVDTSKFTAGLLVVTTDNRVSGATGDTSQWQTLATYVSPTALATAQNKGTLSDVAAYDLSSAGHTAFANLAGTASTGLATTGAVIGLVTGPDGVTPVDGATITLGGTMVAGGNTVANPNATTANPATAATPATVTKAGTATTSPNAGSVAGASSIYYANAAVTAGATTGPTSTSGLFLAVPADKTSSALAGVSVTPGTGSALSWTVPTVPAVSPLWLVVNLAGQAAK